MPGATTHGYEYPVMSDPLSDWPGTVQDLSETIESDNFSAWTAPTLLGAWVNLGGVWEVAGYKKVGSVVKVRGAVKDGTAGTNIFTLPSGFRPAKQRRRWVAATSGGAHVTIQTDGDVELTAFYAGGTNASVMIEFEIDVL